jgi:hypothetical protein
LKKSAIEAMRHPNDNTNEQLTDIVLADQHMGDVAHNKQSMPTITRQYNTHTPIRKPVVAARRVPPNTAPTKQQNQYPRRDGAVKQYTVSVAKGWLIFKTQFGFPMCHNCSSQRK